MCIRICVYIVSIYQWIINLDDTMIYSFLGFHPFGAAQAPAGVLSSSAYAKACPKEAIFSGKDFAETDSHKIPDDT